MSWEAVGVDLGGTKLAAGRVADGRIETLAAEPTPAGGAAAILEAVVRLASRVGRPDLPVGLAVAGQVEPGSGTVLGAPNLPLAGVPVRTELARRLGVPVRTENDVTAAAVGQWLLLDPPPAVLAVITVGTGVGGGVVVDGRPFGGAHGLAVEAGHVVAVPGGERCACGRRGCVEAYAGGRALLRRYRSLAGETGNGAASAEAVLALARAGDPVAVRVWEDARRALEVLVRAVLLLFDPDVLALGGGVASGTPELRHAVAARAAEDAWPGATPPAVVELDSGAAVVGAARLAWAAAQSESA